MTRGLLCMLGIVRVLHLSVPAQAQERPGGFYLTSPFSLSSGYDDNVLSGPQALDSSVSVLTSPTASWIANTHRTMFSVDYRAEFDIFSRDEALNAWSHAANLLFRRQITSRLSLDAGDSFLSTMDPTEALSNSLLLLPRGRYQENNVYGLLAYRLDHRTVLSVRLDSAVTTMALPGELAGLLDRVGLAGTVTVAHLITRHHALSGSYAYLYVHPLRTGPAAVDAGVQNANLGYVYTINPGLTIRVSGGAARAVQSSFTGAAEVDKRVHGVRLSAGYQRYLAFFGGMAPIAAPAGPIPFDAGLAPSSVYQVASLRVWGKLTNRVGLDGNVQRSLNGVAPNNRGIKSVSAQFRLDYKVRDRLTVFVRSEFYGQNISEFSPLALSRRRYFGGLEIALSRPPATTEDPHRHKPLPPGSSQTQQEEVHPPEER